MIRLMVLVMILNGHMSKNSCSKYLIMMLVIMHLVIMHLMVRLMVHLMVRLIVRLMVRLIVHLVLIRILVGEMQFLFAEPGCAARQLDDGVGIIREGW